MTISKLNGLESGMEMGQKINEIIDGKADVNADTTGNAGTATKLANARTISLTGDITGSTTFDGSANKSITTTLGNTTKIDGQWVSSVQTLSTATAVGTYTIDLSSYLPNDNYNYEVAISIRLTTLNGSSGGSCNCVISTNIDTLNKTVTQNSTQCSCYEYIQIDTAQNATFKISNHKLDYSNITAYRYRRIGTNT